MVRRAIDWCNLICPLPVGASLFATLASTASLEVLVANISFVCERQISAPSAPLIVFQGKGLRFEVRRPSEVDPSKGRHGVLVQVQGQLCSLSPDGVLPVVETIRAVRELIYGGENVALYMGRVDLCVDVWATHPEGDGRAASWVTHTIFADGNAETATARFATRSSQKTRRFNAAWEPSRDVGIIGSVITGRTLGTGTCPRLIVYEKCRPFAKNESLAIVRDRWVANGYDGTGRVVRIEWKVVREWLTENGVHTTDGRVLNLARMPVEEALTWLPQLLRELAARTRHTEPRDDGLRPDRRRTSRAWELIAPASFEWESCIADAARAESIEALRGAAGKFLGLRREQHFETVRKTWERSLVAMHVHVFHNAAAEHRDVTLEELAFLSAQSVQRGQGTQAGVESLVRTGSKVARRYGYNVPPSWGPSDLPGAGPEGVPE